MFIFFFFFFNDTATTEIYTLSLHDALPISRAMLSWLSMLLLSHPQAPCVSCSRPPIIRQVYRSTQVSGVVGTQRRTAQLTRKLTFSPKLSGEQSTLASRVSTLSR